MNRLTVLPFLMAMFAAVMAMPTNVYQICAWNAGTLKIEPWRKRSAAAMRSVTQGIRAWLAALWTPRLAFASLALLLAVMLASQSAGHEGFVLALGTVVAGSAQAQEARRATLVREAEALRGADGNFADDAARRLFDVKMAEVEAIDVALRGQSQFVIERNPLDPGAPTTAQRLTMDPPQEPNERDLGASSERVRVQGIIAAAGAARLPSSFADRLIGEDISLLQAQTRVFEEMARREPAPEIRSQVGSVEVGTDPLVHVRAGIENAMLHRLAPAHFPLGENGRNYRGMTMLDVARAYLQARGVRVTSMGKNELAGAALGLVDTRTSGMHTTSDFALLLADVANKTLRRAYDEQPQTFAVLGRRVTIPDFKPVRRLQFGDAPDLLEIEEHGEYKSGTIGEGKEQYQLATYGRKFAITRKALINDDTDAFSRVPMMFGRKARTLESNLAWAQITSNPTMGDGNTLFSAAHGNVSAVAGAIAIDALGDGRASLRMQTSIDGEYMNLSAKYLIVPPSLETLADQFVTVITAQQAGNANPFQGRLTVLAEPRLEAASNIAWYLAATPEQIDMLEFGYLEGEEGPMVESRVGFDVDGVEIKCRLDFAAKVIDWRGFYRNTGAS